jgi:hypothetical protein
VFAVQYRSDVELTPTATLGTHAPHPFHRIGLHNVGRFPYHTNGAGGALAALMDFPHMRGLRLISTPARPGLVFVASDGTIPDEAPLQRCDFLRRKQLRTLGRGRLSPLLQAQSIAAAPDAPHDDPAHVSPPALYLMMSGTTTATKRTRTTNTGTCIKACILYRLPEKCATPRPQKYGRDIVIP